MATMPVVGDLQRRGARPTSRRLTRRALLGLLAGSAGLAAAGACLPFSSTPQTTPGRKAMLVYQDWRTEWFPRMAQEMLERFHASHPNIRVYYLPDPENLEEKMPEAMQAGTAPDVFQGCCAHFPVWAQKGYTLDLRKYVGADIDAATVADWDTAQYRSLFTRDGKQYALPKYLGALALYYNKDLFEASGVAEPNEHWTHEDYLTAMKALSRDRNADGQRDLWGSMVDVSWDRLQVHVNAWGGHLVEPSDGLTCRMGEPEALAAFEWLRARIWDDHVMASLQDTQRLGVTESFVSGRLAMVEDGSWALKYILSGANFRVGVAPLPRGPAARATLATTDGFGIYAGTREPDAAWELLKFLVSPEYGRAMAAANFLQPARASLLVDWAASVQAQYPGRLTQGDLEAFAHGQRYGYSVTTEVFATNMAAARQLAQAAWSQLLTLGQGSVDQLRDVCSAIQSSQQTASAEGRCC